MEIKLRLGDNLYNSGLVGLIRILQHAGIKCEIGPSDKLYIKESDLEGFEKKYFYCLIDKYGFDTSYNKMVIAKDFIEHCHNNEINNEELGRLNDFIDNARGWLTSNSYQNTYDFIKGENIDIFNIARSLRKVNLRKGETISDITPQIKDVTENLLKCIKYLEHPEAKLYLSSRVMIYTIIQGFWNNVSFLNRNASKKDPFTEYNNYFIKPITDYLQTKKDEKKYAKNKLSCATCENKMGRLSETFDLTWLQKVGVDAARKSSYYWDHQRDTFICPICNLVYSCVPLGFTLAKGQGIFVNNNQSIEKLISSNELLLRDGDITLSYDKIEEMAYYKIIDVMTQSAERKKGLEINNIQIVKFDRNNESRPYTFNILSKQKIQMIADSRTSLNYLVGKFAKDGDEYLQLYQEVIYRIYNGQTFNDLLFRLMKLIHAEQYRNSSAVYHILKIANNQFKGGESYMTPQELEKVRSYGYWLRNAYRGSENKLGGILHRMLNALKVKNPHRFMETLIQAYSYQKKEIPSVFVQMLSDKNKFQTIGYAFLIGLVHGERKNSKEDKIDE